MQIKTARQVWHDCGHIQSRGGLAGLEERSLLGTAVQTTDRGVTANESVHGAIAGWFQSAIAKLHPQVRVFGDFMYSAGQFPDVREAAEEMVFNLVMSKSPRMTAAKRAKAEYVIKGVMTRYRYMHQGGQSANADPLENAEAFRAWLFDSYDIQLDSRNWDREWEGIIRLCFDSCEDIDRMALSPIAALIYQMKEAA